MNTSTCTSASRTLGQGKGLVTSLTGRLNMGLLPCLATCLALTLLPSTASASDVVVHAGLLYDGLSATPRKNVSVVIHDDRITGIREGFVKPAGATVIDLSNRTVLPGWTPPSATRAGNMVAWIRPSRPAFACASTSVVAPASSS